MHAAPPTNPPSQPPLRRILDELAGTGARRLRQWQSGLAWREAVSWAPLWLGVAPLLLLLARLLGLVAPAAVGAGSLVVLTLAGPAGWVLARVAWSLARYQPSRAATLALHDRNLATQDRLVTADEFLGATDLTGDQPHSVFMRAAVDDATAPALRARTTPLPPLPLPAWHIRRASWWGAVAAAGLVLLGRLVGDRAGIPGGASSISPVAAASDASDKIAAAAPKLARAPRPPVPPQAAEPVAEDKSGPASKAAPRRPRNEPPMDGQAASGGGAGAGSSSSGNHAAGLASSQRSAPKEQKPETPATDEPEEKEQPGAARKKAPKKQDSGQLAMESSSGQGKSSSASGSLNPFESPEEKDKAGQSLQADAEDQGDEDEDEQQKSASVGKPIGDTKKPAVDRNLSTNPNGPPSDQANGRGGPGEIKKTRGVPSMILGIPVPDRIPGTPSPGRSKVTQEFTRPKEEAHPAQDALAQNPRTGATGPVEQPDLAPWRRALVENYFLSIRPQPEAVAAPDTPPTN